MEEQVVVEKSERVTSQSKSTVSKIVFLTILLIALSHPMALLCSNTGHKEKEKLVNNRHVQPSPNT